MSHLIIHIMGDHLINIMVGMKERKHLMINIKWNEFTKNIVGPPT